MASRRKQTNTIPYLPTDRLPEAGSVLVVPSPEHALRNEVVAACAEGWSGEIRVRSGEHLEGLIMLTAGRIAWAVSSEQHEDLGTFLWRLGRITKDQLFDVRKQFARHHGTRKLGVLLEEAGLIRRPVLRRCLLLHARMAISSLLGTDAPVVERHPGEAKLDGAMTFTLDELLPELAPDLAAPMSEARDDPNSLRHPGNEVLYHLEELSHYLAFAVVTTDGEVIAIHSSERGVRASELGVFVASALDSCSRAAAATPVGPVSFVILECTEGELIARWVDDDRRFLALLLLRKGADRESPKYALLSAGPAIARMVQRKVGASAGV